MGYSLCMMADFQNALISGVFGSGMFWNVWSFLEWILTWFLEF